MEWVGRYQLLRRIESGRTGVVYLVLDSKTKREVVLKMVQLAQVAEPDQVSQLQASLQKETESARQLRHPKIVAVKDIFQEFGLIWVMMPFIKGKSLLELVSGKKPPRKETVLRVFQQVAECLDYAHGKQVLHQHLKPSKILVQENGIVRVLGFGLSGIALGHTSGAVDESLPTPNYLSPEQVRGRAVDGSSDQFSLAVTVYQILTGERPFTGEATKVSEKIAAQDPVSPENLNSTLPSAVGPVLLRALAKNPKDRYHSCREFVDALEGALEAAPDWLIPEQKEDEPEEETTEEREEGLQGEPGPEPEETVGSRLLGSFGWRATTDGVGRYTLPAPAIWILSVFLLGVLYFSFRAFNGSEPEQVEEVAAVTPELWITTSDLPEGAPGEPYVAVLAVEGEGPPYRWSVSDGSLPPGLRLDRSNGMIRGTPTDIGAYRFTAKVTLPSDESTTRELSLLVGSGLRITTPTLLPRGVVESAYSHSLFASGTNWPHRWSLVDGSLPSGLVLDSSSGMIRGMPVEVGEYRFTMRVTDSSQTRATREFTLSVGSGLTIATAPVLPRGILQTAYVHRLVARAGKRPFRWSLAGGSLPAGLELDRASGRIGGTPEARGDYRFTVEVTDASSFQAGQDFELTVGSGLTITTAPGLASAVVARDYSRNLAAGAGRRPYRWSISAGSLPSGLSLSSTTGRISGTPRRTGQSRFTVRVTDALQETAIRSFTLRVGERLAISSAPELRKGRAGRAYSSQPEARGGAPPYRWLLTDGSMPPGLSLDPSTGAIGGTPTLAGQFEFVLQVTDGAKSTVSQEFALAVDTGLTITTDSRLQDAEALVAYSQQLTALEGIPPYRWMITDGALPEGLVLEPSSGVIRGTPTADGEYTFAARVVDFSEAQSIREFGIEVVSPLHMSAVTVLPEASVGEDYLHTLTVSGGNPPFTWSVLESSLPAGLSLDPATGVIRGRPTSVGRFRFNVAVTSGSDRRLTQPAQLTVNPPSSGEIVWRGNLDSNRVLTIQDARFASVGSLTGELPGVPIKIELEPERLVMVTPPGPENDWKLLVIHSGTEPRTEIKIRWTRTN